MCRQWAKRKQQAVTAAPASFLWVLSPWVNFTWLTIFRANNTFACKSVNTALPSYCGEGVHIITSIQVPRFHKWRRGSVAQVTYLPLAGGHSTNRPPFLVYISTAVHHTFNKYGDFSNLYFTFSLEILRKLTGTYFRTQHQVLWVAEPSLAG